jgi:hypothetical protein
MHGPGDAPDRLPVHEAHPLVGTADRMSATDPRLDFATITSNEQDGWVSLREAASHKVVRDWLDELPMSSQGMRNVAGARVGLSFACLLVRPLMAVLHMENRVPVLTPDTVLLRRAAGQFVQMAVLPTEMYALPTDPDIEHPRVHRVHDVSRLTERMADELYGALAPVLSTVRAEGRYGLSNLWGGVLDMIGATSLLSARIGRLPQEMVWQRAEQLCDLINERSEQRRVRYPRPFEVSYSGGDALFTVKGTCCLQYREHGLRAGEQDDAGTAYCKTCPFLREDTRLRRCASTVERDARALDATPCAGS